MEREHPSNIPATQYSTISDVVSGNERLTFQSDYKREILQLFNGRSSYSDIEGVNRIFIRYQYDSFLEGHELPTWYFEEYFFPGE